MINIPIFLSKPYCKMSGYIKFTDGQDVVLAVGNFGF